MKSLAPRLTTLTLLTLLTFLTGCYTVNNTPLTDQQRADQLANGVALASGAAVLPRVKTIAFTLVVREGDDVKVSRSHYWNVKAGTDTVTVGDKSMTINTNGKPNETDDPDQAAMFKAWTNDAYWLTAPLKLFDPGVTRQYLGRRDVNGKTYEVLHLSFGNVGLTPEDHYNLYIDPYTSLIAYWDYMPNPDTTWLATWEQYRHPAGLTLSTYHKMGNKVITMENISVATE
jgi:hypothetical protein